ncbi:hypothetical protein [Fusobacterium sp. PH5-44]|uniref:hypothetical protein n=1 Tax=unclassified Fusobacterium TaxID=2648384 RepID=UPI003D224B28
MSSIFETTFSLNNPLWAFVIVVLLYFIGEFIGTVTKAWVPSVFVTACLFLFGYWYIFPVEKLGFNIIDKSGLGAPLGGMIAVMILITHMGTVISIKQLSSQWKVICVAVAGLIGLIIFCLPLMYIPLVGKVNVYAGLPPLTGGIVAAIIMRDAAAAKGLQIAATLAIALYAVQGFFGYPLTAFVLKKEGKLLLDDYKRGEKGKKVSKSNEVNVLQMEENEKTLLPKLPKKYMTSAFILGKLMLVAVLATVLGSIMKKIPGLSYISNPAVISLILGIVFTEIGFLDKNSLVKAKADGLLMMILMLFVFSGFRDTTPATLKAAIVPMLFIIIFGIIGMGIVSIIVGKSLGVSWRMSFAVSLTALYGFPPNYILTEESVKALTDDPEEHEYLMSKMLPQMIVGGFVTVTISSVIIAGIFVELLNKM